MKYYARTVTHREEINRFGKLGFVPYVEMFKANRDSVAEALNKGKRIRFTETTDKILISILRKVEIGKVIAFREESIEMLRKEKGVMRDYILVTADGEVRKGVMRDYILVTADGEVRGRFSQISLARAEKNRIHREEGIDVTIETRAATQLELPIGLTLEAIQNDPDLTLHHKAMRRGYISRRTDHVIEPYRGKFGEGYVVSYPRYDSTRYVTIEYYVKVPKWMGGCRSNVRRSTGWACTRSGEGVVIDGKRCKDTKPCFEPRGGGEKDE